jgi:hypothetical protein
LSNKFLRKLRSIKHQGWQFIITFTEYWFYLATDYERIWLRPDQEPPEGPQQTTQENPGDDCMESFGFHVLEALPKGRTIDSGRYRDNTLTALVSLRPEEGGEKLVIHAENARPIRLKSVSPFGPKTGWDSPHTHRTRLISQLQISFCSDISNTVCKG